MAIASKLSESRGAVRWLVSKNGILAILIAVSAVMVAAVVMSAPEPDKKVVAERAHPVTTITAEPAALAPELSLFGKVETPRRSSLTAAVSAHVDAVNVRDGDWVEAGELLIQLDPTDAALAVDRRQADHDEARANLETLKLQVQENEAILAHEAELAELSEAKLARYRELREQGMIAEETLSSVRAETKQRAIALKRQQRLVDDAANQLLRAEAAVSRTRANLREAQVALDRTNVRSPFTGRVTQVAVSPGELVRPGTMVAEVYDTDNMEVRAQIPPPDVAAIRRSLARGESLHASVADGSATARLTRLSGQVSEGHSSVEGLFVLEGAPALELGRAVSVVVQLPAVADAVAVPLNALYGNDNLYVVRDARLQRIHVERLGEFRDAGRGLHVIVRSAEMEGNEPIVTSRLPNAVTGLKVSMEPRLDPVPLPFMKEDQLSAAAD